MIVAVEGPSAAGKTTWCRSHADPFVPEYDPTVIEPRSTSQADHLVEADHWVEVNTARWAQAVELETEAEIAVCDSDPLKLHYSWCLAAVGAAPVARFAAEAIRSRAAFASGRLGLADVVVVLAPDEQTLRRQKLADDTRRRRSFELHARLREPLLAWYSAVERVDPGRVFRDSPSLAVLAAVAPRGNRSDVRVFDDMVAHLPAI